MMNRRSSAAMAYPAADHCPATAFIRSLLSRCREGQNDPDLVIMNDAAEATAALAHMEGFLPKELSCAHLIAAQRSLPDVTFRYAAVFKDGKPLLFACFQVFTLSSRSFNLHRNSSVVKHILSLILNMRKARVVVTGNALRTDLPCFCFDRSLISNKEALETVAAIADRIADRDDASAIILTGTGDISVTTMRKLASWGYSTPLDDNTMEMNIPASWLNLQDYIAALSRKYKTRANKILAAAEPITIRPIAEVEIDIYQDDINRLFAGVIDKQPFVFTTSGGNYITELKRLYKDNFEIMGLFNGDQLIAFYSAFITPAEYELFYVGFDIELNATYQLYFNMLFSGLDRAISLRKNVLKLGRTSFDAKASLGAKPVRKDYLIRLHHIPDAASRWLVSYFSSLEDGGWKLRNPLKEQ